MISVMIYLEAVSIAKPSDWLTGSFFFFPEKRLYEAKPYRSNNSRRGSSQPQHRGERKSSRSYLSENTEREQRSSGRGRGR